MLGKQKGELSIMINYDVIMIHSSRTDCPNRTDADAEEVLQVGLDQQLRSTQGITHYDSSDYDSSGHDSSDYD